jgi:hypothetical protein
MQSVQTFDYGALGSILRPTYSKAMVAMPAFGNGYHSFAVNDELNIYQKALGSLTLIHLSKLFLHTRLAFLAELLEKMGEFRGKDQLLFCIYGRTFLENWTYFMEGNSKITISELIPNTRFELLSDNALGEWEKSLIELRSISFSGRMASSGDMPKDHPNKSDSVLKLLKKHASIVSGFERAYDITCELIHPTRFVTTRFVSNSASGKYWQDDQLMAEDTWMQLSLTAGSVAEFFPFDGEEPDFYRVFAQCVEIAKATSLSSRKHISRFEKKATKRSVAYMRMLKTMNPEVPFVCTCGSGKRFIGCCV